MNSDIRIYLCTVVMIVLCLGCGNYKGAITYLPNDAVILAFGDSLTYGTGTTRQQSFPAELASITGYKVINAGVPGELTNKALRRLPNLLEQHNPQLVILCHGGNDMLQNISPQKIQLNLELMIEQIRASGAQVILVGVPKPGLIIKSAPLYHRIAKSKLIPFEQEVIAEVLSTPSLKIDQIHPNTEGYKRIAEALAHLLPERMETQTANK